MTARGGQRVEEKEGGGGIGGEERMGERRREGRDNHPIKV